MPGFESHTATARTCNVGRVAQAVPSEQRVNHACCLAVAHIDVVCTNEGGRGRHSKLEKATALPGRGSRKCCLHMEGGIHCRG